MSEISRRVRTPLVVLRKIVVGWALIAGMALYAVLAGAKQVAQWLQPEKTVPTATAKDELPPAQPKRVGGADSGVDGRSD